MCWQIPLLIAVIALTFVAAIIYSNLRLWNRVLRYEVAELPSVNTDEFVRVTRGIVRLHVRDGNSIELLPDGERAFAAMFDAVRGARHTVTFENFVYWSGSVGREFAELLAEKSRAGVRIHLLLDWVGSLKMDTESLRSMRDAGVQVHRYHSPRWHGLHHLNHRTHRRELVVDGRIGFTGGVGIGDEWIEGGEVSGRFRDYHYRIEGPLVADLQSIFMDNWLKTSGEVLHADGYFPDLSPRGPHRAAVLASTPKERATDGRLLLLVLLRAARSSILIEQPYFVPDQYLIEALSDAAKRNVNVELILPKKIDLQIVRHASRGLWEPLLESGVRIHEYQPSMLHAKISIVDGLWTITGSLNLDFRSMYRNDETLLAIMDERIARDQTEYFEQDRTDSAEITLDQWRQRPWTTKLLDNAAGLLRTQL